MPLCSAPWCLKNRHFPYTQVTACGLTLFNDDIIADTKRYMVTIALCALHVLNPVQVACLPPIMGWFENRENRKNKVGMT